MMLSSLLETPTRLSDGWGLLGFCLSSAGLAVLWCYTIYTLHCIWPNRHQLFRCVEGPWLLLLLVSLTVGTIGHIAGRLHAVTHDVDTIYGTLKVNRVQIWTSVTRGLLVVYFCPTIRPAFSGSFVILSRLVTMFALMSISFVCHYFAIKAVTPSGSLEETRYFDSSTSGAWNMFVLLTTANHPDVLMPLYHDHPVRAAVLLFSFMGINVYFLMNLLLGVVFAEYQSIMADKLLSQKQLRRAMLFTAYSELDSCDAAVCGVKRDDVKYLMSQYAYGSASGSEEDQFELWWQLLSDGTEFIDFDRFSQILKTMHTPVEKIPNTPLDTAPVFPQLFHLVHTASIFSGLLTFNNFMDFVTIVSVIWGLATASSNICQADHVGVEFAIEVIITAIFLFDVIVQICAQSTHSNKLQYLRNKYSWLDMVSTGLMMAGVVQCMGGHTVTYELRALVGMARALRCFRLTHTIVALRRMVFCATSMFRLILPQLTLFLAVYYCFAVVGMALFAGDTTKSITAGGPGHWDTSPWATSLYGQACANSGFYYDLNFDTLGSSFVTLFVCMVQNNWNVVSDGFVQTRGGWCKMYFLTFNVFVVINMLNVLVATMLSLYNILQEHSEHTQQANPAIEAEYNNLELRLARTTFRTTWRVKPAFRNNSVLFKGTVTTVSPRSPTSQMLMEESDDYIGL